MNYNFKDDYEKGQIVYYLRVIPKLGVKEVYDCIVGAVKETLMFVCDIESRRTYVISADQKDLIYINRKDAIKDSKKVKVDKVKEEGEKE